MRILAAGGGTAGHLFPALAVLEEFQKRHDVEILYVAVEGKIDERVLKREHPSYRLLKIRTRGLKRPLWRPSNVIRAAQYMAIVRKIKKAAVAFKPDFLFLTGGYAAGLVAMATKGRFKTFVHEQNAVPGLATLYSARFAHRVFVSFERTKNEFPEEFRGKIKVVGNPLRDVFYTRRELNIPDGIVLVMGGSLGSEEINEMMERVYEIDAKNIYYHSTGNDEWTRRLLRFKNVVAMNFFDFTPLLWRKAKFVVARAGATTVYEMIRYGVRGILVPWKGSAESHQSENAKEAVKMGMAKVIEPDVDPRFILEEIESSKWSGEILTNPAKLIYESIMEAI